MFLHPSFRISVAVLEKNTFIKTTAYPGDVVQIGMDDCSCLQAVSRPPLNQRSDEMFELGVKFKAAASELERFRYFSRMTAVLGIVRFQLIPPVRQRGELLAYGGRKHSLN